MVGRIEMGAVMGRQLDRLHRPALAVRQIFSLEAFKETQHPRQALLVIVVLYDGMDAWRIGRHVVLQRHGNVDQFSRHGASSVIFVFSAVVGPLHPSDAVLITYDFGLEERSWRGSPFFWQLLLAVVFFFSGAVLPSEFIA